MSDRGNYVPSAVLGKSDGPALRFDLEAVRAEFPALAATDEGVPRVYLDNPAGTQVPKRVADRVADCLLHENANLRGTFRTSRLADEVMRAARAAMADFLNAESPDEIIFGQNMTSLTLHLSRSIGKALQPGDEIVVSKMDHDANVYPWILLARDLELQIRWLEFDTRTFEFDLAALDGLLNSRTRLVCVCGASNLTGTINDLESICRRVRSAGAWSYIDAVQSAPHVSTDVQKIDCDFLVCSAYKFFGPHQGILWGRREVLEQLEPYKVRPAPDRLPWCFETGTQSLEGIAGTAAAVDYLAWIGETLAADYHASNKAFSGRRRLVHAAMDCIFAYEQTLSARLLNGLQRLPGVTVQGITAAERLSRRVPTVSFTHSRVRPATIAAALGERNIFVWSGHNYALEAARSLHILESGGAVRIGPVHYNSIAEIDRTLGELEAILG